MGKLLRATWAAILLSPAAAFADATTNALCKGADTGSGQIAEGDQCAPGAKNLLPNTLDNITNVLLYVAGAVAVIIIIISGIRYVTSTGDSTRVKQAKDTLLYAIVGLIVVILAYAIVNFVATQIK